MAHYHRMKIATIKSVDRILGRFLVACLNVLSHPEKLQIDTIQSGCILIIRPGGIGDAVLLTAAVRAVRRLFPDASLHILAEKRNAAVFSLMPGVDAVYRYDVFSEFFSVFRNQYDLVIDTEQWHFLSAAVARLLRPSSSIGFATNQRHKMFSLGVEYSHDEYEADLFLRLVEPLGIGSISDSEIFDLCVPKRVASAHVNGFLDQNERYIAIFAGASIPERCWGKASFRELVVRLRSVGWGVLLVGGVSEERVAEEIVAATGGCSAAGHTSLAETALLIKRSALLVTGDSGILHLGVAVGVPTVSLFGPGIAAKWAPRGEKHRVINLELPCSPCTRFGTTPPCPIGAKCIQDISVDMVWQEVQTLLDLTSGD